MMLTPEDFDSNTKIFVSFVLLLLSIFWNVRVK